MINESSTSNIVSVAVPSLEGKGEGTERKGEGEGEGRGLQKAPLVREKSLIHHDHHDDHDEVFRLGGTRDIGGRGGRRARREKCVGGRWETWLDR